MLHAGVHAEGNGDLFDDLVQQVARLAPHLNVQAAHSAGQVALGGNRVGGDAGADLAPSNQHARTNVGAAGQHGGNLHRDLAHRVDEVLGQVGSGGMAAVAAQVNLHGVGGAGNRTDARTDLTEVHLRVTVQGESTRNVLEQALGNHLYGTTG